jgi:acetoacetyl-CoA synthetase
MQVRPGQVLWRPPADAWDRSRLGRYLQRMSVATGTPFDDYDAAWRWSVGDLEGFWSSVVDEFDVAFDTPGTAVLEDGRLPGARWFPGAKLNFAAHALRRRGSEPAVIARSQTREDVTLSWDELADQVGRVARGLRRLGVEPGDRVVAYAPNVPETLVAFLACASIGAVWSSCPPEFGVSSVVDRIAQIGPSLLLVVDGYRYGSKRIDRSAEVAQIRAALPSLRETVVIPYLEPSTVGSRIPEARPWSSLLREDPSLEVVPVPFDHPLYVLYSSGTTGLPKAIVHGHGGILLEHLKVLAFHQDVGEGDRILWFTTTGWMMWNRLASSLLVGSTVVLFDGDPTWPDLRSFWELAAELEVTVLGVGAAMLVRCQRAGLSPGATLDLSRLRSLNSTASPLPLEGYAWVYEHVGRDLQLSSASGGTDVCTALVGSSPLHAVHAGEIACRCLGVRVEAFDDHGRSVVGRRGELVVTAPMPSMPVRFWDDPGDRRYHAAYFDRYPNVWRHGDWIEFTDRGTCIVSGRSDATLNRGGVRMGTAEFYAVVERSPAVRDSLVVHVGAGPRAGALVLFVVLDAVDADAADAAVTELRNTIRSELSPRHVPDEIHVVDGVPRTMSGKKMEVPVKRLLEGEPLEAVATPGAMRNPESLGVYVDLATSPPMGEPEDEAVERR